MKFPAPDSSLACRGVTARQIATGLLLSALACTTAFADTGCDQPEPGARNLYWGDLHVHTALSLDAYIFGTTAGPAEAYAFARGGEQALPDGTRIKLQRPLDFAAVTDHAESFDTLYLCTNPRELDLPYCEGLRSGAGTDTKRSWEMMLSYFLPSLGGDPPQRAPICQEAGVDCPAAAQSQWQRVQRYANEANAPCEFTAFIGNEWSATPGRKHWHRNLIYAGSSVSRDAIDYVRFPSPQAMWRALEEQCKPERGCEVIAIPHNGNMAEGGGFDVETSPAEDLRLRARYERLFEVHQSKGSSECLTDNWRDGDEDCGFEIVMPKSASAEQVAAPGFAQQIRRSYARNVLSRGLQAYSRSAGDRLNPLQLGFTGSTDNHVATPGAVDEASWKGDAWGGGGDKSPEQRFGQMDYNPGGLVAIWAEQNTRASLFDAMQRREVYATSGTRIKLRFQADLNASDALCGAVQTAKDTISMGGSFAGVGNQAPRFAVTAAQDSVPLTDIQIIKGTLKDGEIVETVQQLLDDSKGVAHTCVTWADPGFDPQQPAYWYARVLEAPTPRWSKTLCEQLDKCAEYPDANRMIQERAWSSPIWYLP